MEIEISIEFSRESFKTSWGESVGTPDHANFQHSSPQLETKKAENEAEKKAKNAE